MDASPTWPYPLYPQHFTAVEPVTIPHVCNNPASTRTPVVVIPETPTGVEESVAVPSPICPYALYPQHLNAPVSSVAHVLQYPVATAFAFEIPETVTGLVRLVVVPSPSAPFGFSPQHFTSLVDATTRQLCASPAEIVRTSEEKPDTVVGLLRLVVVPSPSCP